jgi:hypothetical protein
MKKRRFDCCKVKRLNTAPFPPAVDQQVAALELFKGYPDKITLGPRLVSRSTTRSNNSIHT